MKFKLRTIGAFLIASSIANAGKYDDVDIVSLDPATFCSSCLVCPIDTRESGECGEKYVKSLLTRKGFDAYLAQYNGSNHGIDVIAFKYERFSTPSGIIKVPLLVIHESKYSENARVVPSVFKSRLKSTESGRAGSRTWINHAVEKMTASVKPEIQVLASKIKDYLSRGAYVLRTGNLRVDRVERGIHHSWIQFYRIQDDTRQDDSVEVKTMKRADGPFGVFKKKRGRGIDFIPQGKELPYNDPVIQYLRDIFEIS